MEIGIVRDAHVTMTLRSEHFGMLSFTEENLFAALLACRRALEKDGYLILCNGARKDAYPSRMTLRMGGGQKIYLFHPGKPSLSEDLVDTLGAASIENVGTIAEQRAAYEAWIAGLFPHPTPLQKQLLGGLKNQVQRLAN